MAYKKVFYTRRYQAPPPVVGQHKFFALLKKRKLEEIRVALESGEFEQQHDSNCIDTDDEESNASTSCTASPRSSRAGGAEAGTGLELSSRREQQEAQAAAERASETARRKAEDDLLNTIHAKLQERQAAAAAEKLAEKHELEEQHAAASQQIREVQQRLEQLREAKHDLVKQLKQVSIALIYATFLAAPCQLFLQNIAQRVPPPLPWCSTGSHQRLASYLSLRRQCHIPAAPDKTTPWSARHVKMPNEFVLPAHQLCVFMVCPLCRLCKQSKLSNSSNWPCSNSSRCNS